MRPLLLLCLTLATATQVIQTTPQRVERRQEWRWCVRGESAGLEKRTVLVVDGRLTEPTDERLVTLSESNLTLMGAGY